MRKRSDIREAAEEDCVEFEYCHMSNNLSLSERKTLTDFDDRAIAAGVTTPGFPEILAIISKTPQNVKESEKRFLDPSLYLNLHRGLFWVLLESVRLFCETQLTNQPTHQQTDRHGENRTSVVEVHM